jgi:hypothetical protein
MFLEIIDVTGIHRMGYKLWLWRTVCNGTGSGHRQLTLLHMICMPLIAYMNFDLAITLRFSGEGTRNSHMAGGMELLATWSHVMEMSAFVGVILVIPLC